MIGAALAALGAIVVWDLAMVVFFPFPFSLLAGWGGNLLVWWAWSQDHAAHEPEDDTRG